MIHRNNYHAYQVLLLLLLVLFQGFALTVSRPQSPKLQQLDRSQTQPNGLLQDIAVGGDPDSKVFNLSLLPLHAGGRKCMQVTRQK